MSTTGRIVNGHVKCDGPVIWPEGTPVRIEPISDAANPPGDDDNFLKVLGDAVGSIHDLPEDASINHDHYLYGVPKRQ